MSRQCATTKVTPEIRLGFFGQCMAAASGLGALAASSHFKRDMRVGITDHGSEA